MSNLHNNEQNIETLAREACCAGKLKNIHSFAIGGETRCEVEEFYIKADKKNAY